MRHRFSVVVLGLAALTCESQALETLYYGGEALLNEQMHQNFANPLYDDVVVSGSPFRVEELSLPGFLQSVSIEDARLNWEVWQGRQVGNFGTLVTAGNASASFELTGRSNTVGTTMMPEYQFRATVVPFVLQPGTYHFRMYQSGAVFGISRTDGLGRIGFPVGHGNSLVLDNFSTLITTEQYFGINWELPFGIYGSTVPEPGIAVMLCLGGYALIRRRRN